MLPPLMAVKLRSALSPARSRCPSARPESVAAAQGRSESPNEHLHQCGHAWPNAGPQRFAAVGGTETVTPRQVAFGVVATYLAPDPVERPRRRDRAARTSTRSTTR